MITSHLSLTSIVETVNRDMNGHHGIVARKTPQAMTQMHCPKPQMSHEEIGKYLKKLGLKPINIFA